MAVRRVRRTNYEVTLKDFFAPTVMRNSSARRMLEGNKTWDLTEDIEKLLDA